MIVLTLSDIFILIILGIMIVYFVVLAIKAWLDSIFKKIVMIVNIMNFMILVDQALIVNINAIKKIE